MNSFEKIPTGIFNKVENNKEMFVAEFKDKLQEFFPSAVKDGIVDFEALLNEFGKYAETDEKEKYNMTWVGKKEAIKTANEDIIGKTLKYVPEDSKNTETTQNLYIEGDNLEVLKLLRNSYYGKIKMIYIDPPYNTGNDFIYKDNFKMDKEEYEKLEGSIDEYNERLTASKKGSGRYHSDWMNMMYPRLKVAKDLIADDGMIFISIDDNELSNMKKICDEIYGEENCVSCISVKMSEASGVKMTHANIKPPKLKEYILMYKKTSNILINPMKIAKKKWDNEYRTLLIGVTKEELDSLSHIVSNNSRSENDEILVSNILKKSYSISLSEYFKNNNITTEKDKLNFKFENAYRIFRTTATSINFTEKIKCYIRNNNLVDEFFYYTTPKNELYIIRNPLDNASKKPRLQVLFASNYLEYNPGDFWEDVKTTGLDNEGGVPYKNGKKPILLIKRLLEFIRGKDFIVLDFFSGSSSTAEAVMELNSIDGGNRKYIMVQLPENLDYSYEKALSDTKKQIKEGLDFLDSINKVHSLTEIGKERIRRAGEKIKEENKDKEGIESLDIGFKVFRVSDTNIRWISEAIKCNDGVEEKDIITQEELRENESYKDRLDFNPWFTDLDVVYEMMLKRQDIELTERIEKLAYIGDRTYLVGYTILVCLEENITEEMVRKISEIETSLSWIVFRDSAFGDDINLKTNTINLLRTLIKEKNPRNKNQKILWI